MKKKKTINRIKRFLSLFLAIAMILDWTPLDDNGTVSLTVEEWRELLKQLPEVMNLLKVGDPHD